MRSLQSWLIFAFVLTLNLKARAEISEQQCHSPDYTAAFGPVHDQGQADWCSARAVADYISFHQGVKGTDGVSSYDVMIRSLATSNEELVKLANQTGDPGLTTYAADYKRAHPIPVGSQSLEMQSQDPMKELIAYEKAPPGYCTEGQLPSQDYANPVNVYFTREKIAAETSQLKSDRSLCLQSQMAKQIGNLVIAFNGILVKYIAQQDDKTCTPRHPLKPLRPFQTRYGRAPNSYAGADILKALNTGAPPLIFYDANFLTDGFGARQSNADHVNIVVASQWNPKLGCQFKLRNSWGAACSSYSSDLRASCEDGYIWVDEKHLNERVDSVITSK